MSVSPDAFRQVLGSFASGVAVVTTRSGSQVHGTTMSAFSSLSLDPPLVLVCVDKSSDSHGLIADSGIFAVNILHRGQSDLSVMLSRKETPDLVAAHGLEGIPFRTAVTGAPILRDHLAYLDCRVTQAVDAGDHTVYIGSVEEGGIVQHTDAPLVYYRGRYGGIAGAE